MKKLTKQNLLRIVRDNAFFATALSFDDIKSIENGESQILIVEVCYAVENSMMPALVFDNDTSLDEAIDEFKNNYIDAFVETFDKDYNSVEHQFDCEKETWKFHVVNINNLESE